MSVIMFLGVNGNFPAREGLEWHKFGSRRTTVLLKELIYHINLMHTKRQNDIIHFDHPSHYYRNLLFVFIHSGEGDRGPYRCP